MAAVQYLADMTQETLSTGIKKSLPLPFFGIFKNPVNGREVIVADSSTWTLHIPIQGSTIFQAVFVPIFTSATVTRVMAPPCCEGTIQCSGGSMVPCLAGPRPR